MKVLMILPDGMRPDSLANIEKAQKMISELSYSPDAPTVAKLLGVEPDEE